MDSKSEKNRSDQPKSKNDAKEATTRGGDLGPTKGAGKQDRPRREDDLLDEALEESFPASDPPARSVPVTGEKADRSKT
jgi:hypothetical protein